MNIGVISAFDSKMLKEFLIEDKNKRGADIINKTARYIMK